MGDFQVKPKIITINCKNLKRKEIKIKTLLTSQKKNRAMVKRNIILQMQKQKISGEGRETNNVRF